MPNLITLVCPTCGGKLQVLPNATALTCQFCGNEHMVKREADGGISLEAHARCPVCGRNDRVEKVSALLVSQTQEISGIEQKQELVGPPGQQRLVTHEVPFTRKQVTVLGQHLVPPAPPDASQFPPFPSTRLPPPPHPPSKGGAIVLLVIGILIAVISLVCGGTGLVQIAMGSDPYYGSSEVVAIGVILLVGAILLILVGGGMALGGILLVARVGKVNPTALVRWQQQVDALNAQIEAVRREHERINQEYECALERYERLYYCARDGCVFIPGEFTSAPLNQMRAYLYQPEPPPSTP